MRHNKKTIAKLKELRAQGFSIPELMDAFNMAKTTVWHHVHDIQMTSAKRSQIRSRQGGSHKRSLQAWQHAKSAAQKILASSDRELALKLAMLYWAEGHKNALVFTNTDPDMLRLYIRFLKKVLNIPSADIKVCIRITSQINDLKSRKYWCSELSLPIKNITTNENDIQNKTRTTYGICRITVVKSTNYHKIVQSLINETKALS